MYKHLLTTIAFLTLIAQFSIAQNKIVVYQSDFGLKDGAVSEMKGVAMGVSPDLKLFDLKRGSLFSIEEDVDRARKGLVSKKRSSE